MESTAQPTFSTMSRSAVPPSPQEIAKKLSMHSPKTPKTTNTSSLHALDSTESDSDSALLTPEISSISVHPISTSASANPPLSAIAEHRSGSGESDDDEGEEQEGGWRTVVGHGKRKDIADEAGAIKAGYLRKKGERRRKKWQKRWFVLRPAHLAYYKTSAEYQLLRLLDLADVHSCTAVSLKKHPYAIGLVSPLRTLYLQAENLEEANEWIEAIESARLALMTSSTQSSLANTVSKPSEPSVPQHLPLALPPTPSHAYATSSDSDVSLNAQHRPTSGLPPVDEPQQPQSGTSKDLPKIVLSGYLMKCGSKRRNWRKRWFVLNGEKLIYSASHMDTRPHRVFAFSQIVDALGYDLPSKASLATPQTSIPQTPLASAIDDGDEAHKAHTFKIVTTKRTLLLCAPSEEEEIKWLGAIRALIARRSVPGNAGGGGGTKSSNPEAVSLNTATGSKGGKGSKISATTTESKQYGEAPMKKDP